MSIKSRVIPDVVAFEEHVISSLAGKHVSFHFHGNTTVPLAYFDHSVRYDLDNTIAIQGHQAMCKSMPNPVSRSTLKAVVQGRYVEL